MTLENSVGPTINGALVQTKLTSAWAAPFGKKEDADSQIANKNAEINLRHKLTLFTR